MVVQMEFDRFLREFDLLRDALGDRGGDPSTVFCWGLDRKMFPIDVMVVDLGEEVKVVF